MIWSTSSQIFTFHGMMKRANYKLINKCGGCKSSQLLNLPKKDILKENNYHLLPSPFHKRKDFYALHHPKSSEGHSQNKEKSFSLKEFQFIKTLGLQRDFFIFSISQRSSINLLSPQALVQELGWETPFQPGCFNTPLILLEFSCEIQYNHGLVRLGVDAIPPAFTVALLCAQPWGGYFAKG